MVRKLKKASKKKKNSNLKELDLNDNEECICGSGFSYKDCCKGNIFEIDKGHFKARSHEDLLFELDEEFIKKMNKIKSVLNTAVKKSKFKQCIHPAKEECNGKIGMKAHSIQNTRILKKLSENNHIIVLDKDVNKIGASFKLVGRNNATTFTGFCNEHDEKIFAPIEKLNFYIGSEEQHFLYAYRSFARSYHKKLEELNGDSYIYPELTSNESTIEGTKKKNNIINRDLDHYKEKFDDMLLSKKYDQLETISIKLNNEIKFAVNSYFQLEYDLNNKLINDFADFDSIPKPLMLNIFPENGNSYILLSLFKEDMAIYKEFLEELENIEKQNLFLILNNLIAFYCENFVISPDFLDEWQENEKRNFLYKYDISGEFKIPGKILNLREKCVYNLFKEKIYRGDY